MFFAFQRLTELTRAFILVVSQGAKKVAFGLTFTISILRGVNVFSVKTLAATSA
jgi:hypothetical protein|tara:strand:- start:518 stop:679 length:162 start_codon:yes stop_codon:yes gene_type:complete